ncbi:hypothetical protein IMG5_113400 [Ichthyophthirius multifiliis]|uniref:Uncharacterized protein n=1 Tax=Ichthyophthirius multifiliis TaxID=5932 RepID=G0QTZ9_ICHMU|nr:hypothetical protein IMG5_113400 [Ichthyophthirius multifiliis]EGR31303.1 hypothetical protein IMG5_113400 [Ichthyophthirius multifiliis]|eukprot:XP_004034789.1 hypothetical protein IMG5_113400 [Ichthyophthirius multifiliis]
MSVFFAIKNYVQNTVGRMIRETGLELDRWGSKFQRDIACWEPLSRHRNILPLYDKIPTFYSNAFISPNCTLIGDVFLGQNTSIGYGSTLRADLNPIRVGHNTNIGDKTVISNVDTLPSGIPTSTTIGNNVNIEDNVVLQSCIIDDFVTIGISSIVLEGSQLERGCVIAPNSFVPAGHLIPAYQLWGGSPVRYIRDLTTEEKQQYFKKQEENFQIGKQNKEALLLTGYNPTSQ